MNLHITPSFNIDRLCKTASVLLFLVIVETARLRCFLHASKKEMNSLNDNNDISQVEVYDQEQYYLLSRLRTVILAIVIL